MSVVDAPQRQRALAVDRSFLVQAPAGSGKTELLIQRLLALLPTVSQPERVLAITFTRKAAAEMRQRLLRALEDAALGDQEPEEPHRRQTWRLARAVLAHDRAQGWDLRLQPGRLQIQTIDSFNAALVRRMPWLARLGGVPRILDDPVPVYRRAVDQLLSQVAFDSEAGAAIRRLLQHLDNRMEALAEMLCQLLPLRDQWLRHLAPASAGADRELLEGAIAGLIGRELAWLRDRVPAEQVPELVVLARYAAHQREAQGDPRLAPLAALTELPATEAAALPAWQALADLLLTAAGGLRKQLTVKDGFPPGDCESKAMKQRFATLREALAADASWAPRLNQLRLWRQLGYSDDQWEVLTALRQLLPLALTSLWQEFGDSGAVDFAEMALRARQALREGEGPSELLLRLDAQLDHILVDEFQDTSQLQLDLLRALTDGWQDGDGRTLFLVGDPMQSIYRFREADVGLFLRLRQRGLPAVRLEPLVLQCNFRAQAALVDWANRAFAGLFPRDSDPYRGAVTHAPSTAVHPPLTGPPVQLGLHETPEAMAEGLADALEACLAHHPGESVALLVRARTHLLPILPVLHRRGIPFAAQEIDRLDHRPLVRDLAALTRALLHGGDRLAWLTLLRAPWCGLILPDLVALTDEPQWRTIPALLEDDRRRTQLSADGRQRLQRVGAILQSAHAARGRLPLRRLVETCWRQLGAPACYEADDLAEAPRVFALIEQLDSGGGLENLDDLDRALQRLYAATPVRAGGLQIMTIHKAKGLEFDHVFVAGLHQGSGRGERRLLRWQETVDGQLLLAPIPPQGRKAQEEDPLYHVLGQLEQEKEAFETARLLYVALTRARRSLALWGVHAPRSGTFLQLLQPALDLSAPADAAEAQEAPPPVVPLRRLRSPVRYHWAEGPLPAPGEAVAVRQASESDVDLRQEVYSGYESETGRHIGTLVHRGLQAIAEEGLAAWTPERIAGLRDRWRRELVTAGVPVTEAETGAQRCVAILTTALGSERGRWILGATTEARCEWPLSLWTGETLVHAVIDRSFLDKDGRRWIIDYKTSAPGSLSPERFLAQEAERYREQMAQYGRIIEETCSQQCVCKALYFPENDLFYVYP